MTDALVTSALQHWAPRLVAQGVSHRLCEEVTAALGGSVRGLVGARRGPRGAGARRAGARQGAAPASG